MQDRVSGQYTLGPGCIGIADAIMRGTASLGVLAGPAMVALSELTGETVAIHVRTGLERTCIGQVTSPQPVCYTARVGAANPIHTGTMGKVLLAFMDDTERRGILDRLPPLAFADARTTSRQALEDHVEQVRIRGYAVSHGERFPEVAAMSVPVLAADGRLIAALSIIGPEHRLADDVMTGILPAVVETTRRIANRLATGDWSPASV